MHRECWILYNALAPIDDIIPRLDMNPVKKNKMNKAAKIEQSCCTIIRENKEIL